MKDAALEGVEKVADGKRPFGRIAYYRAVRG
jgi:hypothetical protein